MSIFSGAVRDLLMVPRRLGERVDECDEVWDRAAMILAVCVTRSTARTSVATWINRRRTDLVDSSCRCGAGKDVAVTRCWG